MFHIAEAQGSILLGLNTFRKIGHFTKHPRVSIETVDLDSSAQNLARCDLQVEIATARQVQQRPVTEAQCSRSARGTLIHPGLWYIVNNNNASDSFSKWLCPEVIDITEDWLEVDSNHMEVDKVSS